MLPYKKLKKSWLQDHICFKRTYTYIRTARDEFAQIERVHWLKGQGGSLQIWSLICPFETAK